MKRAFAFTLAFATLGLTACSGSTATPENASPRIIETFCANMHIDASFMAALLEDGSVTWFRPNGNLVDC
jgi:hypothetical protein